MFKHTKSMLLLVLIVSLCMVSTVFMSACGAKEPAQEAPAEETVELEAQPEPEPEAEPEPAQEPAAEQEEQKEIGEDKALEIALKDAGVSASDITYKQVHLDYDDDTGRQEYEVEFHVGTTEYEYNVDALTGEITEKDMDNDND